MAASKQLDPKAKADIVDGLIRLEKDGQVKSCQHLHLDNDGSYFKVVCDKAWARFENTDDVEGLWYGYATRAVTYQWPRCPDDCPEYAQSPDFKRSVSRDQYEAARNRQAARRLEAPATAPVVATTIKVAPPAKVSLRWLWDHVPAHWWLYAGLALVVAFFVGTLNGPVPWLEKAMVMSGLIKQSMPSSSPDQKPRN
jgi:hypothetical protein